MSLDEIRAAGSDLACKQRKMKKTESLAIASGWTCSIRVTTHAGTITWSTAITPDGRNAARAAHHARVLRETPAGLPSFSGLGFTASAAASYDGTAHDHAKGWLESLDTTKSAVGIMYMI